MLFILSASLTVCVLLPLLPSISCNCSIFILLFRVIARIRGVSVSVSLFRFDYTHTRVYNFNKIGVVYSFLSILLMMCIGIEAMEIVKALPPINEL